MQSELNRVEICIISYADEFTTFISPLNPKKQVRKQIATNLIKKD